MKELDEKTDNKRFLELTVKYRPGYVLNDHFLSLYADFHRDFLAVQYSHSLQDS